MTIEIFPRLRGTTTVTGGIFYIVGGTTKRALGGIPYHPLPPSPLRMRYGNGQTIFLPSISIHILIVVGRMASTGIGIFHIARLTGERTGVDSMPETAMPPRVALWGMDTQLC